jgi:hypothetical protein
MASLLFDLVGGGRRAIHLRAVLAVGAKPEAADLQGPQALLQGFFERPADGHGFTHRLHGGGQKSGVSGNFSNVQRGILTTQ